MFPLSQLVTKLAIAYIDKYNHMGFFNLLRKRRKYEDEEFGQMIYTRFKNSDDNFFEGTAIFNGSPIGVLIEADDFGPTPLQRDFFKTLNSGYPELLTKQIIPFLSDYLTEQLDPKYFDEDFEIESIVIPREIKDPIEWSLCYHSKKLRHFITIVLENNAPVSGRMDG